MRDPCQIVREQSESLPDSVSQQAIKLLRLWEGWKYGLPPSSCAAAAVYAACKVEKSEFGTQESVAALFDVSEHTVRKHWRKPIDAMLEESEQ